MKKTISLAREISDSFEVNELEFNEALEGKEHIEKWVENSDTNSFVYVCFLSLKDIPIKDCQDSKALRNDPSSFLVSHNKQDILNFCHGKIDENTNKETCLVIFEHNSYQDAFEFCKTLKETF